MHWMYILRRVAEFVSNQYTGQTCSEKINISSLV